ncbi:MAG TPA: protein kinase [Polyangiaceae bacterium]
MTFEEQLAELTRQGRFEAAAELCEERGRPLEAARLWGQACNFDRAAGQFLSANRADEALLHAAHTGDPMLIEASLAALAAAPHVAQATALRLEARGFHRVAAALHERLQQIDEAARLYRRAHAFVDAARLFVRIGQFDAALTTLSEALERSESDEVARLALATLLERRGRLHEAARLLQQLDDRAGLAGPMLQQLARLLTRLDLPGAAREAIVRRTRLGSAAAKPPPILQEFESPDCSGGPQAAGELFFGRYEIVDVVATTATARVYKAHDRLEQRSVAVKLFSPSLTTGTGRDAFFRFEREVRVLEELKHPSVVPLFAYHPEGPALILKWMSGGSLAQRLEAGAASPELGAHVVSRVLSALSEAHRRGILHRDIKPDNILFDEHGAPYLGDFGTAHVADHAQTVTQGVLGTLAYMAPPQRQGEAATIRSDLYSVGAVFWHVLTGGPPGAGLPLLTPLTPSQRRLAERWIEVATLPEDAAEMLAALRAEAWPATHGVAPERSAGLGAPTPSTETRLGLDGQRAFDRLLERPVQVHPASPDALERARRFAVADHPGLATVLAYAADSTQIWLECPERRAPGALTAAHKERLSAALIRLHAVGGSHGAVDQVHLGWRGSEPVLMFPATTKPATLSEDLTRLELVR